MIKGTLKEINYTKNNFNIFTINPNIKIKFIGDFNFKINDYLEIDGEFVTDTKGRIFSASKIEKKEKEEYFLTSFINGIGEKTESEIKERLGNNYIKILLDKPILFFKFNEKEELLINEFSNCTDFSKLIKLKGYSKKRLEEIKSISINHNSLNKEELYKYFLTDNQFFIYEDIKNLNKYFDLLKNLKKIGINNYFSKLLIKEFRLETEKEIKKNPYLLTKYMDFIDVDEISINKFGFNKESSERILSGILFKLLLNEEEGSSFVNKDVLIDDVKELLNIDKELIIETIEKNKGFENSEFIVENENIYRRVIFFTERKISILLKERIGKITSIIDFAKLEKTFLNSDQKEAVKGILSNRISILTGGPGTGKTTTVNIICQLLEEYKIKFLLAAPTGRAAKRMTESTGKEAKTIHRLLEYKSMGMIGKFNKNEYNKLFTDFIIIDESSMLDIYLMNALLKAIKPTTQILFIGDVKQLPSVSTGSILKDMKESDIIPVFSLKTVTRQSENSYIVKNCNNIDLNLELEQKSGTDFSYKIIDNDKIFEFLEKLIDKNKSFQVIGLMKRGDLGVDNINHFLQDKINKNNNKKIFFNKLFKEDDKVIQIRNDYDENIYNGDIGKIIKFEEDFVLLEFNGIIKKIKNSKMKNIDLAYSITVHKSQGSEFENVVMLIDKKLNDTNKMLSKEIVYTGISRAKKGLILISNDEIDFTKLPVNSNRATNLKNLLKK